MLTITVIIKEDNKWIFQHFTKEGIDYHQCNSKNQFRRSLCWEKKNRSRSICTEQDSINCNVDGRLTVNISNKDLFKIKLA